MARGIPANLDPLRNLTNFDLHNWALVILVLFMTFEFVVCGLLSMPSMIALAVLISVASSFSSIFSDLSVCLLYGLIFANGKVVLAKTQSGEILTILQYFSKHDLQRCGHNSQVVMCGRKLNSLWLKLAMCMRCIFRLGIEDFSNLWLIQ